MLFILLIVAKTYYLEDNLETLKVLGRARIAVLGLIFVAYFNASPFATDGPHPLRLLFMYMSPERMLWSHRLAACTSHFKCNVDFLIFLTD